jgi:hypothetical protein
MSIQFSEDRRRIHVLRNHANISSSSCFNSCFSGFIPNCPAWTATELINICRTKWLTGENNGYDVNQSPVKHPGWRNRNILCIHAVHENATNCETNWQPGFSNTAAVMLARSPHIVRSTKMDEPTIIQTEGKKSVMEFCLAIKIWVDYMWGQNRSETSFCQQTPTLLDR